MQRTTKPEDFFLIMFLGAAWLAWTMLSLAYANYASDDWTFVATHLKVAATFWTVGNLAFMPRALWMMLVPETVPPVGVFSRIAYRASIFSATFIALCYVLGFFHRHFFM